MSTPTGKLHPAGEVDSGAARSSAPPAPRPSIQPIVDAIDLTPQASVPEGAGPCPRLVEFLNAGARELVRPGSRAIVVGCGVGASVVELLSRGFDALGFDLCLNVIATARATHPEASPQFFTADLLALPPKHRHRYELVVSSHTLDSVEPARRESALRAIADLVGPRGVVLLVARANDIDARELLRLASAVDLMPVQPPEQLETDTRGIFAPQR
jgi:SAM-dependent methyltransferase